MRVILTGGASGGHINPALAIADIIKANDPTSEIIFVGTKKGMENDLIPKAGYKLLHADTVGAKRPIYHPANAIMAVKMTTSFAKAKKIIKEFSPDIVIGTGGYVCWPSLAAAASLGIPTIAHEANAVPGLAIRLLKGKLSLLMTNFESTAKNFAGAQRTVHVGMPMRGEFEGISKEEARKKLGIADKYSKVVLSFGGSLGAQKVNDAALEVMKNFSSQNDDVIHYHSSGKIEFETMKKLYAKAGLEGTKNIDVAQYIYDMSTKMAAADVVICRAGAMTLAELARLRVPAVLIPSPNVTDEHQFKNAKVFADAGAALVIRESEFDGHNVSDAVAGLINDKELRDRMAENVGRFYDLETNRKIYREIEKLALKKK